MKITSRKSKIKTLRKGDPGYLLKDGFIMCPRAGFEISANCPQEYKMIIAQAIDSGWIKPIAHVYGKELTMDLLR